MRGKIKILFDIQPFVVGGVERFLYDLIRHLDRARFEPFLVSSQDGPPAKLLRTAGVPCEVIGDESRSERLVDYIKKKRIDIVQTNSSRFDFALAAQTTRVPHLWCLHGHIDLWATEEAQKKEFVQYVLWMSRQVVCPSQFLRGQFNRIRKVSSVKVIPCGVDLEQIDFEAGSGKAAPLSTFSIAMVANFASCKRHLDFIQAAEKIARKIPEARFYIFGGPESQHDSIQYAKSLRDEVKRSGLDGKLTIEEIFENRFLKFREMSVFVLPSINEGQGICLLEAMALGKPVVAYASGGPVEIVQQKRTGFLLPPKNPAGIVAAVLSLFSNPVLAQDMGRRGRARVEKKFTIGSAVEKYEALYERMVR